MYAACVGSIPTGGTIFAFIAQWQCSGFVTRRLPFDSVYRHQTWDRSREDEGTGLLIRRGESPTVGSTPTGPTNAHYIDH